MIPAYGEVAQKLTSHLRGVVADNKGTHIVIWIDNTRIGSIRRNLGAEWYFNFWGADEKYLTPFQVGELHTILKYVRKLDSDN